MSVRRTPPRLLTIAGSDSGGGAGIQADLKTFAAHGVYGMSAITALTAQNTRGVRAVQETPPDFVAAQIDAVFEDIGVDAVKIGMLASAPIVRTVADRLRWWLERNPAPVVLDPVMIAKSGHALLRDDAVEAVIEDLVPLSTLVTPNLPELERLAGTTGLAVASEEDRLRAAAGLAERGPAILAKGGHAEGGEVVDLLVEADGTVHRFRHPRLDTPSTHGTGCTLSSAIAARLGRGEDLATAVGGAVDWLHAAMKAAYPLGSGPLSHGPVDHLHELFGREDEA
jgi:hydroxymethylpyrimidine/phosphomethylpyrimidine kinase